MSIPSVDFTNSIAKQRLSYKAGGFGINFFFSWFLALIIIFCACMPFIDKRTHIGTNRKNIIAAFNEVYDNLEMNDAEQNIIRNIKYSNNDVKYYYSKRGKVITVLLDNEDVYLNITSFFQGRFAIPD